MNWLPVNGGPLNGGSRLALVAAASAIACSSLVAAVAVRAQEALSPVYSGASITAVPTLRQSAAAGVGGTSFLAARPKHTIAAGAKVDAAVDLRGFVFRGVEARAKFVSGADFLAIPASVLGVAKANPCSAAIGAVATKRQPGKSSVSPAGVSIVADSVATRGAVATTVAGLGAFYAETAINGVGEAYGRVTPSAQVVATGLVTRPARAAVSAGADCQAVGAHVVHGRASVASGGYDVFAAPHVIARGSSGMAGSAELVAVPKRELRPRAAAGGTAGLVASTKTNHGSAAVAVQGAVVLTAKADRKTAAASNALASAKLNPVALRIVKPAVLVAVDSTVNTAAQRRVFASAAYGSAACAFAAFPDTTVREGGALLTAGVALQSTPVVTRYVAAYSGCGADVDADPTRTVEPAASASTLADFSAQALLTATYSRADDLFSTADFAAQPDVTVRMADVAVQATAAVGAAPYVTRYGDGVVPTSADLEAVGTREVQPKAMVDASASTVAGAIRVLLGGADVGFGVAIVTAQLDTTVRDAGAAVVAGAHLALVPKVTRPGHAICWADSSIEVKPTRLVYPESTANTEASVVVDATRAVAGESWALVPWCWLDAKTDITVREGEAVADGRSFVSAVGTTVKVAGTQATTSSDFQTEAVRVLLPVAKVLTGAEFHGEALRTASAQANSTAAAQCAAVADTTIREAAAAMVSSMYASAHAVAINSAKTSIETFSDFGAQAVRVLVPMAEFRSAAHASAGSLRTVLASAHTSSTSRFQAAPDVTVRQAAASASSGVVATAKATVKHSAKVQSVSTATVVAAPVVKKLAQSALGAGAVFSGSAVRSVWATAEQDTGRAFFAAAPDVTVRKGVAVASTSANLFVSALVDRPAVADFHTSVVVHADPTRYRAGNADIYCEVYLRVTPVANLFSFDPDNRTFYRQATTTNFVRNAPITEFRRPA